jgi:hypothetical protein
MSDANSHLVEVDGREWLIEVIGDEAVAADFNVLERNLYEAMRGSADALSNLTKPPKAAFSFPASGELRALIFAANKYFDEHDETADEGLDQRITELVEPFIRGKV